MSYALLQAPRAHFGWLCSRVEHNPSSAFSAIEAVDGAGRIRGMVGLDAWTPASVQMHVALDSPLAARVLAPAAFDWVFNQERKDVALGFVSAANQRALDFDAWLGFREVHRIRGACREGVDLVLLEMRREDCRWLAPLKEVANGR